MNQLTITPRSATATGFNFTLNFSGKQVHFLLTRYIKPLIAEELKAGKETKSLFGHKYTWQCYLSSDKLHMVAEILRMAMEKNGTPYAYSNNIEPKKPNT